MAISADLPPFPSHDAFADLRDQIDEAKREATDRRFVEFCREQHRSWSKLAPLLSADLGVPTKKLTAAERAQKRGLEVAEISADDVQALLRWFSDAMQTLQRLRRARAA